MSFRKNVEYLRKAKKLSQEDLAFKTGVSRQAVSKWESGAAYPETEKILQLCKIFDCTLDELMNDDVAEARKDKDRKYSFNDLLSEITGVLRRTIEMFSSMTARSAFQFILEIGILLLLISILRIPFTHFSNLGSDIFLTLGNKTGMIVSGIWNLILELVYFVVATITFIYIYKIRFLDRFDELVVERRRENPRDNENLIEKNEVNERVIKQVDIKNYDLGIFSILGKLVLLFIKGFVAFMSFPIIFLLLCSIAGVLVGIVWMFEKVYFVGILIFLISFILFTIAMLSVVYNFVVNHRSNWQRLFVVFIVSILGFGIGTGVGVLELGKMNISINAPSFVSFKTKAETYSMQKDLIINSYLSTEYVVDNSLKNTIKIEAKYYDLVTSDIGIDRVHSNQISIYREVNDNISFSKMYDILLTDLKEKKLSNYSDLANVYVKIYTSQANIDKIEENIQKEYSTNQDCNCVEDTLNDGSGLE